MSFDIYLQAFADGEPAGWLLDQIRNAFGPSLSQIAPGHWQAHFDSGESCELFLSQLGERSRLIHNITVHRPCRDRRLWDALYVLLAQPGTVYYFPGAHAPLSRDKKIARTLPADMIDALGTPLDASSGEDLWLAVVRA